MLSMKQALVGEGVHVPMGLPNEVSEVVNPMAG
jgi:hypothetical protein